MKIIKTTIIYVLLFTGFSLISCQSSVNQSENKKATIDESLISVSEANPNGDSELALLMRKLAADADSVKHLIAEGEGNISADYIATIHKNLSAEPTDPGIQTEEFIAFNNIFEKSAKELLSSESEQIEAFNKMIGTCINCHNTFCPGPIVRIKKLYIIE